MLDYCEHAQDGHSRRARRSATTVI